jgi:hypothetical protein
MRCRQSLLKRCQSPFRTPSPLTARLRESLSDDPGSSLQMIEGNNHIVTADGECRHLKLVIACRWYAFATAIEVIAEESRDTALKRR